MDDSIFEALSRCVKLEEADLSYSLGNFHDKLPTVLPSWPNLRRFVIIQKDSRDLNPTVEALAHSCPLLEFFKLQGSKAFPLQISSNTLYPLLSSCSNLKVFSLKWAPFVDDSFIMVLLLQGQTLESITLHRCNIQCDYMGMAAFRNCLAQLKALCVDSPGLSKAFPENLIVVAPKIKRVHFPLHLCDDALTLMMTQNGFECDPVYTGYWNKITQIET